MIIDLTINILNKNPKIDVDSIKSKLQYESVCNDFELDYFLLEENSVKAILTQSNDKEVDCHDVVDDIVYAVFRQYFISFNVTTYNVKDNKLYIVDNLTNKCTNIIKPKLAVNDNVHPTEKNLKKRKIFVLPKLKK